MQLKQKPEKRKYRRLGLTAHAADSIAGFMLGFLTLKIEFAQVFYSNLAVYLAEGYIVGRSVFKKDASFSSL